MTTRFPIFAASLILLLAPSFLSSPALAGDGDDDHSHKEVHRIVIDEDGLLPCDEVGHHEGFRKTKRAFLGVELTGLTPELRRHFGVPESVGVMIGQIVDDSAAERAGLRVGDIVTEIDGREVRGSWDVSHAIGDLGGGETVDMEYWRDGSRTTVPVTLGEKETCQFDLSMHLDGLSDLTVIDLDDLPGLEISQEALETALEALQGIDWSDHLEELQDFHLEGLDERMEELQERMEELQERMQLENENLDRDLESALRDRMRALEERERVRIEAREQAREQARHARQLHEEVREQQEAARARHAEARERARAAEEAARRELEEELARARAEAAGGGGKVWI